MSPPCGRQGRARRCAFLGSASDIGRQDFGRVTCKILLPMPPLTLQIPTDLDFTALDLRRDPVTHEVLVGCRSSATRS